MTGTSPTPAYLAAVAQDQVVCCHLVEARMDDGVVHLTNFGQDVVWGGHTYLALGSMLGFESPEESIDITTAQITASISGVDPDNLALFLDEHYLLRQWLIYSAVFDQAGSLIADPMLIFDGRINRVAVTEDPEAGSSLIAISLTNAWVDFTQTAGRRTNDAEQQFHFPDDCGFEFVAELAAGKAIKWGRT